MTLLRRGHRLAALTAAVLALGLTACGGGDDDGSASSTTATPSTVATTSTSLDPSSTASSTPASGSTSTVAGGGLSASSTVILRGIGPVRVGMTLAEASAGAGKPIMANPGASSECGYAEPEGGPEGVSFMVVSDRIARVDVRSGPVKTLSGAGVGDTEVQVQAKYGDKLEVTPHKYLAGGHYLTLVPTEQADTDYRLIFETDGTKVTEFRAGKQPEVSQVERCG